MSLEHLDLEHVEQLLQVVNFRFNLLIFEKAKKLSNFEKNSYL